MEAKKLFPKDQNRDMGQLKGQSKQQVLKRRGIILEPEHDNEDP